jgi:uncharacterized protein
MQLASPAGVTLRGVLGEALDANLGGRLSTFIVDERSPALALFHPDAVARNDSGDWYGEHAGKWLYAAARAAVRSRDAKLLERVHRVADFIVARQDADGYAGTYATARRFMCRQPPKPESWDGAPFLRTWDVWTHSYLILGLLEVDRHFRVPRYLDAACRIGDLLRRTLADGIDITELGNHHGLSATVLIDPAVELYFATGEQRFLDLAQLVLQQADRHPRLALLTRALAGVDAAEIATGKAYQLIWNFVGIAKLYRATGEGRLLEAVEKFWRNVRTHHLTLGGGPCGGVGHRSREVFNAAGTFSPYAYVETCSVLAWVQLNRELLSISGSACYAGEIERSAYNDLLGAQAENGEDWCYYSFPNGRRIHTTYWRCCKSSGAMALEELAPLAYSLTRDDGVAVNLLSASTFETQLPTVGSLTLEQRTRYPFEGAIAIHVHPERSGSFPLLVRIPQWATQDVAVSVNGAVVEHASPGTYCRVVRDWRAGDIVTLALPMRPRTHRMVHRNVQESRAPDGSPIEQEVLHFEYLALSRGPLVYATSLIDGFKHEETVRLPRASQDSWLRAIPSSEAGEDLELQPEHRLPIVFTPYYRTGGRRDGAWRLTWMSLATESQ